MTEGREPPLPLGEDGARIILESVTDAFFLLDSQFRFSYLNPTAATLLGRPDLVGKIIWDEFPAARGTQFQFAYERAMHAKERVDFIEHYPAPLDRWYSVRAYPSEGAIAVYFQDITDNRRAEEELRRSRDQMELVVRAANIGVWYCPLPFDVLIWDDKVKEHFHLPPDAEVTIDTFYERIHPDDREATRAAIARSVEQRTEYAIDYRTVSPDGTRTKWIHALGRTFYGTDGTPLQFDGITLDVSPRKQAELAVRANEERFRLATRATNDIVWDWTFATDEVIWNQALEDHFGHVRGEETDRAGFWTGHIHPEDRDRVTAKIHGVIADAAAEHWEDEYRFLRADGTYADVLDRGYVLRDGGGRAQRMIGAMQDLTERKRVERERERTMEAERAARSEAERQNRMKDEFLAMMSHELRTPLNAVCGWSQMLLARTDTSGEVVRRGIETIDRNARAQTKIIDDLLDMSRMLSGKVRLDAKPVDVLDIIQAAVDTARPAASAKGVELTVEPATARGFAVQADTSRLEQVLWNLLSNAVKFTPKGGHVRVGVEASSSSVAIHVVDDGEGITSEFLPFVFERFRQADASITRRHGGLGLGLAIAKQLVELHGGTLRAESSGASLGSRFSITLPRLAGEAPTSRPEAVPALAPTDVDLAGVHVLVVDDEPDARHLVARLLADRGAAVTDAASVAEALALFESDASFAVDVLVSDIGMPGQDGYELVRRLRALPKDRGRDIPAIAVTAYTRPEDRARALAEGFLMHITKPIDVNELVVAVAAARRRERVTG